MQGLQGIHGAELLLTLLGAVALMLWGVRMVRTGMTRAFGPALRSVIAKAARNRMTAFAAGLEIGQLACDRNGFGCRQNSGSANEGFFGCDFKYF